ncbi:DUF5667 domain-containing protein [Bacillus sp. AFS041924]|uniref:DUF5667 domain-containing protein n=1 Tax=Bacillus sp. AFS041924 TaxID=2033503 RepID=UPI000BFE3D57|nr:DUF5667 domain-containing protein [Bacillus sp. AFS041924]PGS55276.1 hypothetical protein COC46_03825 [Bacillus sp. AFS041924]
MKKLLVHTTATALLLSQLGFSGSVFAAENESASKTDLNHKEEAPALLKGDFFYFVKTTVEKIQLLLTTDKVKEAELLAEFAQERIHEARELIKEGKEDLAKETIKEALGQMENAQGQLPTITEPTTPENATTEGTVNTKPAEDSTEVEKVETEKDEKEHVEKQKLTKEQKEIAKIQHHLNNNLLVLADVLDKVKNPKAKAAIAKNIEKSFNKISERLEKVLKHSEKNSTVVKPIITVQYPDTTTEKSDTPEVITMITKIEDVKDTDLKNVNEDDATEVSTKPAKVKHKEVHHKDKHKSKEEKVVKVKKDEKAVKHEVKKHENGTVHRHHGKNENRGNHKGNEKHEWKKSDDSNDQGENNGNGHHKH